jgi:hypothetical protein
LLAMVLAMSENPMPVMSAELFMMTDSMRYWSEITSKDVGMNSFVE